MLYPRNELPGEGGIPGEMANQDVIGVWGGGRDVPQAPQTPVEGQQSTQALESHGLGLNLHLTTD